MLPELNYNPRSNFCEKICKIVSTSKRPSYVRLDKNQQVSIYNERIFNTNFKIFGNNSKIALFPQE